VSSWRVAGGIVLAPARSVARPVAHEPASAPALPSEPRYDAAPVAALPAPQAAAQPARRAAPASRAAASGASHEPKRAADTAARTQKDAPASRGTAAGGYGPRLTKSAAPADKPAAKPALVRPALNGEKPALAAAGTSDDDWETF
ncbi:MAG: methyl-accepting chemotaxis protein, partial [Burkholderia sp.]|nr:methyl-accepting chemotaxis protein [Burkholderia sp.]